MDNGDKRPDQEADKLINGLSSKKVGSRNVQVSNLGVVSLVDKPNKNSIFNKRLFKPNKVSEKNDQNDLF